MVGAAIVRALEAQGASNIITRTHAELDLTDQAAVNAFFAAERPQQVYLAAAKVGGIWANNTYPAEFIYQNLMIEANIIHAAHKYGVERLLFLGSSCIYPRLAEQPMREEALLTGTLEPTNEPYAIAKIAGIKLCESYNRQYGTDFRSVMPTNLYGPGDNFELENSHVIPALIRKFHEAKTTGEPSVEVWGSGKPRREFLHVDDMAEACLFVMGLAAETYQRQHPAHAVPHQRRHRTGRHHRRPRTDGESRDRFPGRDSLRCQQARRRPAQAARRLAPPPHGLAAPHRPARRPGPDLRLVPSQPQPIAEIIPGRPAPRGGRKPNG